MMVGRLNFPLTMVPFHRTFVHFRQLKALVVTKHEPPSRWRNETSRQKGKFATLIIQVPPWWHVSRKMQGKLGHDVSRNHASASHKQLSDGPLLGKTEDLGSTKLKVGDLSPIHFRKQSHRWYLWIYMNIGFEGLAFIQGQIYNPETGIVRFGNTFGLIPNLDYYCPSVGHV